MERQCNWHIHHPLPGGVANRLPLCSAQYFTRSTIDSIPYFDKKVNEKSPLMVSNAGIDKGLFIGYTVYRKGRCDKRFTPFQLGNLKIETVTCRSGGFCFLP